MGINHLAAADDDVNVMVSSRVASFPEKKRKSSHLTSILAILSLILLLSSSLLQGALAQESVNDATGGTFDAASLHQPSGGVDGRDLYDELDLFGEDPDSYTPANGESQTLTPSAPPTDTPTDLQIAESTTAAPGPTLSPSSTVTPSLVPASPTATPTETPAPPTAPRPSLVPTSVPSILTTSPPTPSLASNATGNVLPNDDIRTIACTACGIEAAEEPFDLGAFQSYLEHITTEFANDFEALAAENEIYREQLDNFKRVAADQIERISDFLCLEGYKVNPPVVPPLSTCPAESYFIEIAAAEVNVDNVKFIEDMVVMSDTREQIDTSGLITGIQTGQLAVSAAQAVLDAVPECGGVSGDACSGLSTTAKIAAAAAIVIANTALFAAQLALNEAEDFNDGLHFEYTQINQDNIIEAHRKLDRIFSPWGEDPGFELKFQGCDGLDQNCNDLADECEEDNVPPTITLREKPPDKPFQSIEEAHAFLDCHIEVTDDCAAPANLVVTIVDPPPSCTTTSDDCECPFMVTVVDMRCIGLAEAERGAASTTEIFILAVDDTPPEITCGFFTPQDPNHVSDPDFDRCTEVPPFPPEDDFLHIDGHCFHEDPIDVEFWYQIDTQEGCDGVVQVDLKVLSNELEGCPEDGSMAKIVERRDMIGKVHRAKVYLDPVSCWDGSKNSICEVERTEDCSITTRFYDIQICATDAAGNVGTKTCSVIVVPEGHYEDCDDEGCGSKGSKSSKSGSSSSSSLSSILERDSGSKTGKSSKSSKGGCEHEDPNDLRDEYELSKQRYLITEYSLEWDDKLITDCLEPPLPQPYKSKGKGGSKSKYSYYSDDHLEGKGSKGGYRNCARNCHADTGKSSKGSKESGSSSSGSTSGGTVPGGETPGGENGAEAQILPSLSPSTSPGPSESPFPSLAPSTSPGPSESPAPSLAPSTSPRPSESSAPSLAPSSIPSLAPSASPAPSSIPSLAPSASPGPSTSPDPSLDLAFFF